MQLQLKFPSVDDTYVEENKIDNKYLAEFKVGNFSNLQKVSCTQEEIFNILVNDVDTSKKVKRLLLMQQIKNILYLNLDMDADYINYAKDYNDELRELLKYFFKNTDNQFLKKNGLNRLYKFNNNYWEIYGGKSINQISVINEDHERYEKFMLEKKSMITDLISKLYVFDLDDNEIKYYTGLLENLL